MTSQTVIEVVELRCVMPNDDLWGAFRVKEVHGSRLELIGWALGINTDVETIEVAVAGSVVASVKQEHERLDLLDEFPDRDLRCGFEVAIEAQGSGDSTLEVRAVLSDGRRAPLGDVVVTTPEAGAVRSGGASRASEASIGTEHANGDIPRFNSQPLDATEAEPAPRSRLSARPRRRPTDLPALAQLLLGRAKVGWKWAATTPVSALLPAWLARLPDDARRRLRTFVRDELEKTQFRRAHRHAPIAS